MEKIQAAPGSFHGISGAFIEFHHPSPSVLGCLNDAPDIDDPVAESRHRLSMNRRSILEMENSDAVAEISQDLDRVQASRLDPIDVQFEKDLLGEMTLHPVVGIDTLNGLELPPVIMETELESARVRGESGRSVLIAKEFETVDGFIARSLGPSMPDNPSGPKLLGLFKNLRLSFAYRQIAVDARHGQTVVAKERGQVRHGQIWGKGSCLDPLESCLADAPEGRGGVNLQGMAHRVELECDGGHSSGALESSGLSRGPMGPSGGCRAGDTPSSAPPSASSGPPTCFCRHRFSSSARSCFEGREPNSGPNRLWV